MDESMNSVHSISAMDISPASSPRTALNPVPSNQFVLNAFQHQQQSLSNILFNPTTINKNPLTDDNDLNSKSFSLYSTVLTENTDMIIPSMIPDENNQIRQRIVTEPLIPTKIESPPPPTTTAIVSNSSRQSSKKLLFLIPLIFVIIYLLFPRWHKPIIQSHQSNWQNASEYLTQNLLGQDQALEQFKQTMDTHKNFSVVLVEGPIGTGKTYLASSLEKFIPTTLISTETLLGLSPTYWTNSSQLLKYLSAHLTPTSFQFLILDDLDLISKNDQFCETLTIALHGLNSKKNIFILLLQTDPLTPICKSHFENLVTKSIQFQMLQRQHIRQCILNEAYRQNIQPTLNDKQIDELLKSLEFVQDQGISYGKTGCKQIPSLVILARKQQ